MTKEVVEGKQPVGEEKQDRFFAEFPYPTYEEWRQLNQVLRLRSFALARLSLSGESFYCK
ncbi:MAG TPA: hypothetical protein DCP36_00710 [Sporomusaceae bacterium]|uniref:hypothetical protein n=1 Tax=Anaerospora sp. TaxID=1960278 RepID=UPI000EB838D9|nr:hypothetical protein [Anaerospora sp.]HAK72446.1 hypothetical protein [Sporomusaceae bacterium]